MTDGKQELQQKLDALPEAMKWRLGISIGFLIPLMYMSMHHMFKEWFGIPSRIYREYYARQMRMP